MLRQRTLRAARLGRQSGNASEGRAQARSRTWPALCPRPGEAFSRAVERFAEQHVFRPELLKLKVVLAKRPADDSTHDMAEAVTDKSPPRPITEAPAIPPWVSVLILLFVALGILYVIPRPAAITVQGWWMFAIFVCTVLGLMLRPLPGPRQCRRHRWP